MTYDKHLLTVEITTKSGNTVTVADTSDDQKGTAAWGLIRQGADLLWKEGEDWMYMAHDCICSAKAIVTTEQVEKPEDDCCQKIERCKE